MKYYVDNASLKNIVKKIEKDSNKALLYCWEYLQGKLQEQIMVDSYDKWDLARSINYQLIKDWVVEVWSNLFYAVVREYWRRPWTYPNFDAISHWSARKGIISWWETTPYDSLSNEDKWIVFIIARAIAVRWIEWKHTFENVYEREKANVIKIFKEYMW